MHSNTCQRNDLCDCNEQKIAIEYAMAMMFTQYIESHQARYDGYVYKTPQITTLNEFKSLHIHHIQARKCCLLKAHQNLI